MKRNKVSREVIYKLILHKLKCFTRQDSYAYYTLWSKSFRTWLGRKKRIVEKANEMTDIVMRNKSYTSKRKLINSIDALMRKFYYEYKTNAKKEK